MTLDEYKTRAKQDLDNAFEKGKAQGGGDGYYDLFWDIYQESGNRTFYNSAFNNKYWCDAIYSPKYPFKSVTNGNTMFEGSIITDTLLPINFSSLPGNAAAVFRYCNNLKTIRTLTVAENKTFANWFYECYALENIEFDGTIGRSIDIHWSTMLTAESYHSIMNALSSTASGQTLTLPDYATVSSTYNAVFGEGSWDILAASKTNWTIAYA